MGDLSDKSCTDDQENNDCGGEDNDDDGLHPVVLEIYVEAALVQAAPVLPHHSVGLCLLAELETGLT